MSNTKDKGIVSELTVLLKLSQKGYLLSVPYGDNAPYDFLLDKKDKVLRVQVKTANDKEDGSLVIPLSKKIGSKRVIRDKYSNYNVDAVIAYSYKYDKLFYIDLSIYSNLDEITLRPKKCIARYCNTINIAEDFLLDNYL